MTISLTDAKRYLRIPHSDDDAEINALIAAATAKAESYLGTKLNSQTAVRKFDKFGDLSLPAPLVSVNKVTYVDSDGVSQTLYDTTSSPQVSSDVFQVVGLYTSGMDVNYKPYITLDDGQAWPSTKTQAEAVTVTVTAGYATVPENVKYAVLLLVNHLYENREASITGVSVEELPMGFHELLNVNRKWG